MQQGVVRIAPCKRKVFGSIPKAGTSVPGSSPFPACPGQKHQMRGSTLIFTAGPT